MESLNLTFYAGAAAAVAQLVKRPGLRSQKRDAAELTSILGHGMWVLKNPSRAICEANIEVSARFGK